MASEDKRRASVALPTIQESDEDVNDLIEDILRTNRKGMECRTPSKRNTRSENSKAPDSETRRRTSRQCAETARVKITSLYNHRDRYSRDPSISEEESNDSSDAYLPLADDEIMPKGECKIHLVLGKHHVYNDSSLQMVEEVKMKK